MSNELEQEVVEQNDVKEESGQDSETPSEESSVTDNHAKDTDATQDSESKKTKYLLEHDRPNCIGCAACEAIAPDFWVMDDDGKSDIINCRNRDDGWEELDLEDKDYEVNKEAAESCPVNVIHIVDKETGKKII